MGLQIVTVPCLQDNYAFLAHDAETGTTAVVDAPEAAPILSELDRRGWRADIVLLTHHHADHIQGLGDILERHAARVVGAAADAHRLPRLDQAVTGGDRVSIGAEEGRVIAVPGHTLGHIAYHFPDSAVAFTGDSLMALGCGRVFEGTMPQMWDSLQRLAALPPETQICSGHEYTAANARFALSVEPGNAALQARARATADARQHGQATVPSRLSDELATNPFLRADTPQMRAQIRMENAPASDIFAEIRTRKDRF